MVEQALVPGRVGAVHPAGEHGHRQSVSGQRAPVGGGVDAESRTGHHGHAVLHQAVAELARHVGSVGGGGPGAHDGHRPPRRLGQGQRPAHPETKGCTALPVERITEVRVFDPYFL